MAARMEFKSQSQTKQLTQHLKDNSSISLGVQDITLPFDSFSIYPYGEDHLLCLCKDNTIKLFNLKTMQIEVEKIYLNLECAKILLIENNKSILLYHRRNMESVILDVMTLREKVTFKLNFLEIAQVDPQLFVARTYDKPDCLQIFAGLLAQALKSPLLKIPTKISTQWTIVRDIIVKLPEDDRDIIKPLQIERKDNHKVSIKKLKHIEYASFGKGSKLSRIQSDPAENAFNFTVHNHNFSECISYFISFSGQKRVFKQCDSLIKLPDTSYLVMESPNYNHGVAIKGRFKIWNTRTNFLYPFDELFLPDIQFAGHLKEAPLIFTPPKQLKLITNCHFKLQMKTLPKQTALTVKIADVKAASFTEPTSPLFFTKQSTKSLADPDEIENTLLNDDEYFRASLSS